MLEKINAIMWAITTVIIIILGLYFSKKLSYPQLRIKKIIKALKTQKKEDITPVKTLYLTLAGRIGVGSIAGVALAIYIGGPGTIFWMWIVALATGSLAYTETMLAIKYKKENFGGPSYYIKKGLNNKALAITYSLIVIIAYLLGFIPIQSNTIIKSNQFFLNNNIIIGLILSIIVFLIIKGGITKITKVTDKLVPIMTIIYIIMAFIAIINNIDKTIETLKIIIIEAFNIKPFLTGFITTMLIGIQRGIFSNESGLGLGGIAACASNNINPSKSGYIQVLGIYITTIIICTSTALLILIFDYQNININNPNGIEITISAFNHHFATIGNIHLTISILLFSFTTILTGYYYCEASLNFLNKNNKYLKIITPLSVFLGTISSPNIIWNTIDILVAILALINLYALYKLKDKAFNYHQKYDKI